MAAFAFCNASAQQPHKPLTQKERDAEVIDLEKHPVSIAAIHVGDEITCTHIHFLLLEENEILFDGFGTLGWLGISVSTKNSQRAIRILRADARKQRYYIEFKGERGAKYLPLPSSFERIYPRVPYSQMFAQKTRIRIPAVRKALSRQEVSKVATGYSFIEEINWRKRNYLNGPGKWRIGYDIHLKLSHVVNGEKTTDLIRVQALNDGAKVWVDLNALD